MIIKDNFLTAEQLILVNQMIEKDIAGHSGRFERYDDEMDHHETDDCSLFYLNKEIKDYFFGLLVERGVRQQVGFGEAAGVVFLAYVFHGVLCSALWWVLLYGKGVVGALGWAGLG